MAGRRDLLLPLALTAVVALGEFNFKVTLPLLARTVFHTNAAPLGLLTAGMAVGSLTAFAALLTLSGLAPTFGTSLLCLGLTGGAMMAFAQSANHRVQLGSDPAYRGRVMAFYTLLIQGTSPIGALLTGWLADWTGARGALSVSGAVCLAAALAAWLPTRAPVGRR